MSGEKSASQGRTTRLQPGMLWKRVKEQTEDALAKQSLLSIPTEFEFVEQDGVRFLVRVLSNLARKDAAKKEQLKQITRPGKEFNPFLPYEEDLFVANLSETHVCILNKYNVVDYHLLIITRAFEEQESLLTLEDFAAVQACLDEIDGLVFYNGGKVAGASQRHKHLQLVPLPFIPSGSQIPIEPLLASAQFHSSIATIPQLPFINAYARLDVKDIQSPLATAAVTFECYRTLLKNLGIENAPGSQNKQSAPYNLLATRQWMLIVPRSQESFESISVNSLGFAGSLFVKNEQQMQLLKDIGPMTLLKNVALNQ
ncbi:phosphorylase [Scytonema sp. UIC 10036]|uniref:ATP adenylyltransferase family protein n=1 Tax=Scytonema sp. UIC 10036 TaxID=2304196 RepID=UPI0012DAE483|nr:phosphorylase [Scytonema sp. UIC 10036]MUG94432.1 phosphorylase [Scytonema sp. UIC 10036]